MTQTKPAPQSPPQAPVRRKPRPAVRFTDWASI